MMTGSSASSSSSNHHHHNHRGACATKKRFLALLGCLLFGAGLITVAISSSGTTTIPSSSSTIKNNTAAGNNNNNNNSNTATPGANIIANVKSEKKSSPPSFFSLSTTNNATNTATATAMRQMVVPAPPISRTSAGAPTTVVVSSPLHGKSSSPNGNTNASGSLAADTDTGGGEGGRGEGVANSNSVMIYTNTTINKGLLGHHEGLPKAREQEESVSSLTAAGGGGGEGEVVANSVINNSSSKQVLLQQQLHEQEADEEQQWHAGRCAINFYGLPRAFKSLVLPSVVENVIKPNAAYGCDYFVHYHNLTYEKPGRSGNGGPIHPEDVFLLQDAVEQVHEQRHRQQQAAAAAAVADTAAAPEELASNESLSSYYASISPSSQRPPPPVVQFCQHTDEELRNARWPVLDQILSNNRSAYYPWRHKFSNETVANIIKMWHGQGMVWDLMHGHEQRSGTNYSRIAMLRSDMVFLTPIDIYQRGKQRIQQQEQQQQQQWQRQRQQQRKQQRQQQRKQQRQQQQRTKRRRGGRNRGGPREQMRRQRRRLTTAARMSGNTTGNDDDFSMDRENKIAVVPGFAKYPVNDRMIYGPRRAVQIWASERFLRLEDHMRYMQKHPQAQLAPGDGIHSERFVAFTIFPAIERLPGVVIEEHPGICFVRARADETIWIQDCERARGDATPRDERQLLRALDQRRAVAERLIGRTCRTNGTIATRRTLECGSKQQPLISARRLEHQQQQQQHTL